MNFFTIFACEEKLKSSTLAYNQNHLNILCQHTNAVHTNTFTAIEFNPSLSLSNSHNIKYKRANNKYGVYFIDVERDTNMNTWSSYKSMCVLDEMQKEEEAEMILREKGNLLIFHRFQIEMLTLIVCAYAYACLCACVVVLCREICPFLSPVDSESRLQSVSMHNELYTLNIY